MVNDEYKLIFIHINKTGGSSIEKVFGYDGIKHEHSSQLKARVGEKWDQYFKCSIIRNPWDRLVSEYFYRIKKGSVEGMGFCDWVQMMHSKHSHTTYAAGPQSKWLRDMDFVGRFETLQESFDYICSVVEYPQTKLPHTNATSHRHYSKYYDEETRKLVEEWHQPELDDYYFEST